MKTNTIEHLLLIDRYTTPDYRAKLAQIPTPSRLFGMEVPRDLNGLKYGQIVALQSETTDAESMICNICSVLFGIDDRKRVMKADAHAIIGLVNMVSRELDRISGLFSAIQHNPTPEELQAGISAMNHGAFGIADWYARRMGLHTHEEAFDTSWLIIYQCMKIDHDTAEYENRLRKIYNKKR